MPEFELVEQLDQAIESMLAGGEREPVDGGALTSLTDVAQVLQSMPSETFKDRLKADLQRRTTMMQVQ